MTQIEKAGFGPLLVLIGPTAVGKTDLSISLAHALNAEIISGDAFQVYRGMDIGTAKIKTHEMQGVAHHLIDICDPTESYTAADFKAQAEEAIKEVRSRDKLPMVVGGTGLYINGLIYHYSFGEKGITKSLRQKLDKEYQEKGGEALLERLQKLDPRTAANLFPNDRQRVVRALEVVLSTGRPLVHEGQELAAYKSNYNLLMVGLDMDRNRLYERINQRVEAMFAEGLIGEVESLLDGGLSPDSQSLKGIGYKELVAAIQGESSFEEAKMLIQRNSRRLAKRQWTWFRRDPHVQWFNIDELNHGDILLAILERANNMFKANS